jgi:hypothetical protein
MRHLSSFFLRPERFVSDRSSETPAGEHNRDSRKIHWGWGLIVAVIMAFLASWPQVNLKLKRGDNYQGTFASNLHDENIYLAYINQLAAGRPRKSDPLVEKRDSGETKESLFSIQFIPPVTLTSISRVTGLSTIAVFTLLLPAAAFISALSLFFLIAKVTDNDKLAAWGTLFTLCLGAFAARDGVVCFLIGSESWFGFFPFLRRYQPGFAFPVFFVFIFLIWRAYTEKSGKRKIYAFCAGLTFSFLVFSYFYLWTTALAWLLCITCLYFLTEFRQWRSHVVVIAFFSIASLPSLTGYFWLLSNIAKITDRITVLEYLRKPDLLRGPEIIGAIVLLSLFVAAKTGVINLRKPLSLLTISLGLTPFLVFNQQLITGRSLQPFHYETFITNYLVLLSVIFASIPFLRKCAALPGYMLRAVMVLMIPFPLCWGMIEAADATWDFEAINISRDAFFPVAKRLMEMNHQTTGSLSEKAVVFAPEIEWIPEQTSLATLWNLHLPVSHSLTASEKEERFFLYLYLSGKSPDELCAALKRNSFIETTALLGYERIVQGLSSEFRRPTSHEAEAKANQYHSYLEKISFEKVLSPKLSYVVIPQNSDLRLTSLDKWYQRDSGETVAGYVIYHVTPRQSEFLP